MSRPLRRPCAEGSGPRFPPTATTALDPAPSPLFPCGPGRPGNAREFPSPPPPEATPLRVRGPFVASSKRSGADCDTRRLRHTASPFARRTLRGSAFFVSPRPALPTWPAPGASASLGGPTAGARHGRGPRSRAAPSRPPSRRTSESVQPRAAASVRRSIACRSRHCHDPTRTLALLPAAPPARAPGHEHRGSRFCREFSRSGPRRSRRALPEREPTGRQRSRGFRGHTRWSPTGWSRTGFRCRAASVAPGRCGPNVRGSRRSAHRGSAGGVSIRGRRSTVRCQNVRRSALRTAHRRRRRHTFPDDFHRRLILERDLPPLRRPARRG